MNKSKHIQLMTLMNKAGINEPADRHDLVRAWTCGRTESSKQLSDNELNDLIWKLQNDYAFATNHKKTISALELNALKEKRSVVLAIAQRVGIHTGTDFDNFNKWMKNSSVLHKKLTAYTYDELCTQLLPQMHRISENYERSAAHAGTKAWHRKYGIPEAGDN